MGRGRGAGYSLGLTCANDVTARELQVKDVQYTRAKGFDTFAPLGPAIALGLDGRALDVEGWVNGERRQASNTRQLIFPIDHLVWFISSVMTLNPGDVISTGTPGGVGFARTPPIYLKAGDVVEVEISRIGLLRNVVALDPA